MKLKRMLCMSAAAVLLAGPALAQTGMPESYRAVQARALDLQRRMLLAMADSMPERLYRDKVTPIQRDFAQQIAHAAGSVPMVLGMTMSVPAPQLPDTARSFANRAGLRAYVNACYDWAANLLQTQTAADRMTPTSLFGTRMERWQVWDELHQHSMWTAGQIVANFRKNGMAPPGFGFF
jgi:hypothetical protein